MQLRGAWRSFQKHPAVSPDELKTRHPAIAWKQMAAAGNVYRHNYEDVAAHFVWETVQQALLPLRAIVEEEIARLEG